MLHFFTSSVFIRWAICLVLSYFSIVVLILLDMCSAYFRCKRNKIPWLSSIQRNTVGKTLKYILCMLAFTVVDLLLILFVKYPVFTLIMSFINCLIEVRSIYENTHSNFDKDQVNQIISLVGQNKTDLSSLISQLLTKNEKK